jgi:hypothetical protein
VLEKALAGGAEGITRMAHACSNDS